MLAVLVAMVFAACSSREAGDGPSSSPGSTATGGVDHQPTGEAPRTTSAESHAARIEEIEPGFTAIQLPEDAPVLNETLIWTGTELILWGGQADTVSEVPAGEPGWAYNPDTATWRQLSPSPKQPVYGAASVWTGERAIVCCGQDSRTTVAYDPSSNSWETLPDAPISGSFAEAVWADGTMILVTGDGAAAYDATASAWVEMPSPPEPLDRLNEIIWTGTEVIVWPADVARRVSKGLALDPRSGTWRVLPEPPEWPAAPDIAWTGTELIIWGGLPAASVGSERAVGSRLDLATGDWTALPDALPEPDGCECNLGSQTLVWTGERLVVSTGHFSSGIESLEPLLLSFDPSTGEWTTIGPSPATSWGADGLMAGDRVVLRSDRLYLSDPDWPPTK